MIAKSVVVATLFFLSGVAEGQNAANQRLGPVLQSLSAGTTIRVTARGTNATGTFLGIAADSLSLETSTAQRRLAVATIDSLWIGKRHAVPGAITGGVIGGLALGALGAFFIAVSCESPSGCHSDYPIAILTGAAVGGAGGALIGGAIGWLAQTWRRVYP